MRIGEVARKANVRVDTIRYYEKRGLLARPRRGATSGYRDFSDEAPRIIRFVKRAQELGFTLDEVEELLRLRADQRASCEKVRERASAKIAGIEEKVAGLNAMKRALELLVRSCRSDRSIRECPILEALDDTKETRR